MAAAGTITKLTTPAAYERTTAVVPSHFQYDLYEEIPTGKVITNRFKFATRDEAVSSQGRACASGFLVSEVQHIHKTVTAKQKG